MIWNRGAQIARIFAKSQSREAQIALSNRAICDLNLCSKFKSPLKSQCQSLIQKSEQWAFLRRFPVLPFLVFFEFLVFFPCEEFLVFLSVFPFFSRDFGGSVGMKNHCFFWWFSLPFSKKSRKGRTGFTLCQIASDLRFAIRITNRNRNQIRERGNRALVIVLYSRPFLRLWNALKYSVLGASKLVSTKTLLLKHYHRRQGKSRDLEHLDSQPIARSRNKISKTVWCQRNQKMFETISPCSWKGWHANPDTLAFLARTPTRKRFPHSTVPCPSIPWFFCFTKEKPQIYQGFSLATKPTKNLGNFRENSKITKGLPCLKLTKEIQKNQGKEGQGIGMSKGNFSTR